MGHFRAHGLSFRTFHLPNPHEHGETSCRGVYGPMRCSRVRTNTPLGIEKHRPSQSISSSYAHGYQEDVRKMVSAPWHRAGGAALWLSCGACSERLAGVSASRVALQINPDIGAWTSLYVHPKPVRAISMFSMVAEKH